MKFLKTIPIVAFLMLFILSGCESQKPGQDSNHPKEAVVIDERVHPAASGGNSAAYFTYINPMDMADTLISVKTSTAKITQIHESYRTEDGMMGMREQKNLVIQPGDTLIFEQGGLHIMLIQLKQGLSDGDTVQLEMEFSKAGVVSKEIPVKN